MLNGLFNFRVKSAKDDGDGVCLVKNGRVSGGGTLMWFTGHYEEHGTEICGQVQVHRHARSGATLFGLAEFELDFEGRAHGQYAYVVAQVCGQPELKLQAILKRVAPLNSNSAAIAERLFETLDDG